MFSSQSFNPFWCSELKVSIPLASLTFQDFYSFVLQDEMTSRLRRVYLGIPKTMDHNTCPYGKTAETIGINLANLLGFLQV